MNLSEFVINRGRGRGKKCNRNKNYIVTNMGPPLAPPVKRKDSTPSSDLNWGKSHISVANTSSVHKSAGSSKISEEDDSRVIIALTEGRGEARCEVGIAAINVSKPLLVLCQISDTQSYINTLTKINIFNPHEILVPLTFVENFSGNRLIDKVKEHFPRIKYTGCARSSFNKSNGIDILSKLCIPSLNAILLVLEHRYYALAAASALITYVQENLFVYYAAGSIKIDYQESEGYAIIDVATADRLELVCSAKPAQGNKYSSLFGVMNHCVTKIGSRTLRSAILQPPCKVQYIEERLSAVVELIKHPEMLLSIQALLQKISNIDLLLSIATMLPEDPQKCSHRQLNYILLLNTLVDLISPLKDVLSKSAHPFFVQLTKTLSSEEFATIKNIVRSTIQENAHPAKGQAAVMQRCFAIKAGINGLLDLVRKTYSERLDDMIEYVKKLAEKYDLALTLGNNQTKGYHIVLNLNQNQKRYMKKSDLPEEFIEVYRLVGSFTMKTPELVNLSTRLEDIMADILRVSNVMIHSIIIDIKKHITLFYKLCEEVAHLDLLQSLAECSVRNGYTRPKFADFTEVTFAHHPMLDFLLPTKPISNPISCSNDYNIHIITGPNGSGKSIFIRQVLLLQIMAQVGCYVPAQSATFRPADRMYARIYLEDNMEHGASSFILEMKEIKYIMTSMTKDSLIIIDELCRSTSVEEGTALAIAVVEKLAQSSAFIYITTHFTLLTKLYDMYLNVNVWQMETIPSGENPKTFKLDYRHNLIPGVTSVKRYGVYIVRNIWPDCMLRYVDDLLDKITKKPKNPNIASVDPKIRLKYNIESEFRKLKSQHKLSIAEINKLLNQYQNELEKLGYALNAVPMSKDFVEAIPQMDHSIFGDLHKRDCIEEDLNKTDAWIKENFTPEQYSSSSLTHSQLSANLRTQQLEKQMKDIFTPEASQQSECMKYSSPNCPNMDFYENYQTKVDRMEEFPSSIHDISNTSSDNYKNISQFLGENSENIQKLIPEVNLYYGDVPNFTENVFRNTPVNENPNISMKELSKVMDDYQFRIPLQPDIPRTSTPIAYQNHSLSNQFCNNTQNTFHGPNAQNSFNKCNFTITSSQNLDDLDLESIKEDLEICSRIFTEDDGFEEDLDTSYKSLPENTSNVDEHLENQPTKETYHHIIPIVTVIEGPNNKTLSFDEDNLNDIPEEFGRQEETVLSQNKIKIISDIVVVPKKTSEQCNTVDNIKESHDTFKGNTTQVSYGNVPSVTEKISVKKSYKNFDSTFEADHTITDYDTFESRNSNNSFRSFIEENEESSHSEHDAKTEQTRGNNELLNTNCYNSASSGYEIKILNNPDKFLTTSVENTICKETIEEASTNRGEISSANVVDKTAITSVSYASKLRKLDEVVSSDTSPREETSSNKTVTGVSSASKIRNLDQVTTDSTSPTKKSTDTTENVNKSESSSSLKESDESKSKSKATKRKFVKPKNQKESATKEPTKKKKLSKRKFIPPRKLSVKEIKEEFQEQDRKILESSPNSLNFSKYLEQLMKRPTVDQIRNTKHLATIRKTNEGVEVIPAAPPRKKKELPFRKFRRNYSNESFSVSIFSDQNALPFESYLNSNEKDYKTFSFNFNKNQEAEQRFQFEPTTLTFGEYTNNSVTNKFVRTMSETSYNRQDENGLDIKNMEKIPDTPHISQFSISQQCVNMNPTPDGFYKENKDDINRILNKYLPNNSQEHRLSLRSYEIGRSIFENKEFDVNDFNL